LAKNRLGKDHPGETLKEQCPIIKLKIEIPFVYIPVCKLSAHLGRIRTVQYMLSFQSASFELEYCLAIRAEDLNWVSRSETFYRTLR